MSKDNSTTLLLVRHGQTEWNAAGRIQGQTNSDLTSKGRAEAEAAATWLSASVPPVNLWQHRPTAIYASDMDRTVQTAAPLAKALDITPILDPDLREMHFGELEGLSWIEAESKFPDLTEKLWGKPSPETQTPGGESRAEMHRRSAAAIARIATQHPKETIAIISHGGVIGHFLRHALSIPFTILPPFSTANGSIAVVIFSHGQFWVQAFGLLPAIRGLPKP
ncbi:MAG: histidine phosphatase family protein [Myxococcales bacterium]|nr:histidine phosphatase family protein [Myxococcales bacterium]